MPDEVNKQYKTRISYFTLPDVIHYKETFGNTSFQITLF